MKYVYSLKSTLLLLCSLSFLQISSAQTVEKATNYLLSKADNLGLTKTDVENSIVNNTFVTEHNNVTHTWLQQQHNGIPVFNGLIGLHTTKHGETFQLGHRFTADLSHKVNTTLPSLTAQRALELAMIELGFEGFSTPNLKEKKGALNYMFESGAVSLSDIPVSACYVPIREGEEVRLAWMLVIDQANTPDLWSIHIDAQTGQILGKNNRTVYCKHAKGAFAKHNTKTCVRDSQPIQRKDDELGGASAYRVFALPTESPTHGDHVLITDPENLNASPFGWHDTDAMPGAEYEHTRGNNVHAYEDANATNGPSGAPGADGGPTLTFDFPMDPTAEPNANEDAAITNLFYVNNMMHDIFYNYGFDEASGNFQANNYGNGGSDGDYVRAEALDGGGVDNANFATPNDGTRPRMQMYRWSNGSGDVITINAPGTIVGKYYAGVPGWGGGVSTTPVTADVIVADDGTGQGSLGCGTAAIDYTGKILLIDRGTCDFSVKALNAQNAGAVACIICNYEDSDFGIGAGAVGAQVNIPALSVRKSVCDLWKSGLSDGLNMTIVRPAVSGPDFLDGDFDNGIIAHEYGHGISNRLTGGGNNTDCLGNAEQMGEGWSDWFALAITTKEGDQGTDRRGVGTYVERQPTTGQGIRRYPYTTDMTINPITFSTVAQNTEVHALGEIWTAVTWDLYWALVEKYGFSDDILNGDKGNNRAIQLVMDGMKLQPCSPGFIDGRDAILLANVLNNNGEDTCLIHEVFARRGMGYLATQGSTNNAADGFENFDPMPTCIKELKIAKECTPTVAPGAIADFTITVTNHKDEAATNVVVTDELPTGLNYVAGSASNGGTYANGIITWEIASIAPSTVIELTYEATADIANPSIGLFADGMEDFYNWLPFLVEGNSFWNTDANDKQEGTVSMTCNAPNNESETYLEYLPFIEVTGNRPYLRFWTKYNTQAGADAGFVEISTDDGFTWNRFVPGDDIRGGYPTGVSYSTLAIPFLHGFSGDSDGWVRSYFDMSAYAGQSIRIRYRFGTDDSVGGGDWYIDNTELIDLVNYDGQAMIISSEGDMATAIAPESGVIVDTDGTIDNKEIAHELNLEIRPNPVHDILSVAFGASLSNETTLQILDANGRVVASQISSYIGLGEIIQIDVSTIPSGTYFLRVMNSSGISVKNIVKQ